MKQYLLITLILTMFIPAVGFCEEIEEREMDIALERDFDNPEHHMHMRRLEMQIQKEEAEMDFQQQMRELELHERKIDLEHAERANADSNKDMHPLLLICAIVHILTAVWVYQDIRKRNAGSGLWIVIVLLTGLLGTLVYAIVRLGGKQT